MTPTTTTKTPPPPPPPPAMNMQDGLAQGNVDQPQSGSQLERISWTLTSLVAVLLIVRCVQFVRKRRAGIERFKRLTRVPLVGEPGLFGGNLYQLIAKPDNCQRMFECHKKLGPTYGLFYGPNPWISTLDLDLIHRVFETEGQTHTNVTHFRLPFTTEINESLAQVGGDKWRVTRRTLGPSFTPKSMKSDNVFEDINVVCDMFLDMIERDQRGLIARAQANNGNKEALAENERVELENGAAPSLVDVNHEFKKFTLEIIFRIVFGTKHKDRFQLEERDDIVDDIDQTAHLVNGPLVRVGIVFGGWFMHLLGFLGQYTALGYCFKRLHSLIGASLVGRRSLMKRDADGIKSKSERKLIDSLIERFDLGKMDDEALKANLFFLLVAGHETSANTLAVLFWLLARNQNVQEKLRHLITHEGDQAEYLNWVIWEAIRLFPAVPAAIGRVLEHDIEHRPQVGQGAKGERAAPILIEKGTTVIASIWTLHHWSEYWGDDVNAYRPERFGEPTNWSPLRFFGFGGGPRYCIGKHLAMAEIRALTARLIVKYRVSLCDQSPERVETISPNLIHYIIQHPIKLNFTQITNL